MALDYTTAINNLTAGNFSGAIVSTYTIPLGAYAWFFLAFLTLLMTYIKTQSAGMTSMVALLWAIAAKQYLGPVGDTIFYAVIVVALAIVMFKLWKG